MDELKMDAAAVQTLARSVLRAADHISDLDWPAMDVDAMPASAAADATRQPEIQRQLADVVAHMRTWSATVQSSTATIESAGLRHAGSLGEPR